MKNSMPFKATLYKDWDGITNAPNPHFAEVMSLDVEILDNPYLINPSRITFAPQVVRTIDQLREEYSVELVWSTTWNYLNAVELLHVHLNGLANGRILPANLNHEAKGKGEWTAWKAEAIIADQQANPRPFVWIDDNAPTYWGDYVSEQVSQPHLIIIPNSLHGLTEEHFQQVREFLNKHTR